MRRVPRVSSGCRDDPWSAGTVVFLGYGTSIGSDEFKPTNLQRTADGFFVKLSYLFRT